MDKTAYFNITNVALRVAGILPYSTKENHAKPLVYLHKIYCKFANVYFYVFTSLLVVELKDSIGPDKLLEMISILGVVLLYSIGVIKMNVLRGSTLLKIYDEIYAKELLLFASPYEELKNIYMTHRRYSNKMQMLFLVLAFLTILPFFLIPWVDNAINPVTVLYDVVENGTRIVYRPRPLPFNLWLPFDRFKYYRTTFALHFGFGCIGAATVSVSDISFYTLMIYAICQIRMLQNCFKNFREFGKRMAVSRGCSSQEEGDIFAIGCFVAIHKDIISYVERLDQSMKLLMLTDVFSTTLQIAVLGFQVIVIGSDWKLYGVFQYIACMIVQLVLFYYLANEIALQSMNLASAIWESDWVDSTPRIKKSLAIIMVRTQKPLCLYVGPFYPMTTGTVLSIMRASYSYLALLNQFYG